MGQRWRPVATKFKFSAVPVVSSTGGGVESREAGGKAGRGINVFPAAV